MRGSAAFRVAVAPGGALAGPWVRNSLWTAARAVPSLDLRFADNKSLVDATTGASLVTFTRASSGTFVDSAGVLQTAATDVPRFDHNPTTGESLGLLVEEARTNLLVQSNGFDTTWTNSLTSETANAGTAPDGTSTAWELKDTVDATASQHLLSQTPATFVSGTSYTFSVWAKSGTLSHIALTFPAPAFGATLTSRYSLATGTVISVAAGTTATVTAFPDGWYRVTTAATATASASAVLNIRLALAGTTLYQGDGTGTILIYGAQLEAGAFATSYIPTTTATVTRAADVASITGTNFSSWFNGITGSFYSSTSILGRNQTASTATLYANGIFKIKDNTVNSNLSRTHHYHVDATQRIMAGARDASGIQFLSENTLSISTGSVYSMASAYTNASTDAAISVNGRTPVNASSSTSITLTGLTTMLIGAGYFGAIGGGAPGGGSMYLNGHIRRLTYWPTRFGSEVLQRITQP